MKVLTFVGTRPEIIRLSAVVSRLETCTDHVLVHTGQNYDPMLSEVFFGDLGLTEPRHFLNAARSSPIETIAEVLKGADRVLATEAPDAVLVLGDTNSCIAILAAKRRRIPTFHMEAGNRCFDDRVPEEINRRIVDHTADINLPYSQIARQYLLAEGLPADRVIVTGSPMCEVIEKQRARMEASDVLSRLGLSDGQYFLVSAHREENIDDSRRLDRLFESLRMLAGAYNVPVLVSTHPRLRKRVEGLSSNAADGLILHPPFGFSDYLRLQVGARVVLSDSGTISEESSVLGLRALNIREAHERPEGMEEAIVPMVGIAWPGIRAGLNLLRAEDPSFRPNVNCVPEYQVPNVSEKVARIVLSYTDYVRRTVWREY